MSTAIENENAENLKRAVDDNGRTLRLGESHFLLITWEIFLKRSVALATGDCVMQILSR